MERYSGFIDGNGYRFEVLVSTTIFEGKVGVIRVYKGRKYIDEERFRLRKFPEWDVPLQTILLEKSDEKTLGRKTEDLTKRLLSCEQ